MVAPRVAVLMPVFNADSEVCFTFNIAAGLRKILLNRWREKSMRFCLSFLSFQNLPDSFDDVFRTQAVLHQ